MTSDDEHTAQAQHAVAIPREAQDSCVAPRRSRASIAVAVCLALAGVIVTVDIIREQVRRAGDEQAARDELRDGWKMLGVLAAEDAARDTQAQPASSAPEPGSSNGAPGTNAIVVNVPPQPPVQTTPNAVENGTAQAPLPAAPGAGISPTPFVPSGALAAPTLAPTVPNATLAALPPTTPGQPSAVVPASSAVVPASNAVVPASNPVQPLPSGAVPASPAAQSPQNSNNPVTFPSSQLCGLITCDINSVCCNPTCGICTAAGAACPQNPCG